MSWDIVTLDKIKATSKSFVFKGNKYPNGGVRIARISDFTIDSITDNDIRYCPENEGVVI